MTSIAAALALLTRLPIRRAFSKAEMAQAPPLFPLVGALVGGTQVLLLFLLRDVMPPFLTAVGLIGAGTLLTGALHLDGLADVADGFGAGRTREDILRIMRDPAIGAYGAVAVVLALMARASAMGTLIEREAASPFLLVAPTLSRWTMVGLGHALTYARPEGGTGSIAGAISRNQLAVATGIAAAVSVVAGGRAIACWGVAIALTAGWGLACKRRLGGFTGDTLGACSELTETAVLIAGVVLTR